MLGVVYTRFIERVEEAFSPEIADQLCENPELQYRGIYTAAGSCEHHDITRMVVHLSEITDIPVDDLVPAFGACLFPQFVTRYPQMFEGKTSFLDFLEGLESSVHPQVRALYPKANLPSFECIREAANRRVKHYESRHPFANLVQGLIKGAGDHFAQSYEVERSADNASSKASFYITTPS